MIIPNNHLSRFSVLGNYVIAQNGVFFEKSTPFFRARIPTGKTINSSTNLDPINELSIKIAKNAHWVFEDLEAHFELLVPPPPNKLLEATNLFFHKVLRSAFEKFGTLNENPDGLLQQEALVWLTYTKENGWGLMLPRQITTASTVESVPICPDDNVAIVVHSHGKFDSFFSATDNLDETHGFIYGVVGNLDKEKATERFRIGSSGFFLDLEVEDVFKY